MHPLHTTLRQKKSTSQWCSILPALALRQKWQHSR